MKYPASVKAPHARTADETHAIIITVPAEMHAFMRGLWRTDEFRKSHDEGGLVFQIVEELARLPRFFYDRTDDYIETSNFTAHYGVIQMCEGDYEKPAIHDLKLLHEIAHAALMPACPDLLYPIFVQKLLENESEASVISEIAAYFDMPGLREKSFGFQILADRYLHDAGWQNEWKNNQQEFLRDMRMKRLNVMHKDYEPQDDAEKWIHLLAQQNVEGYDISSKSYNNIETAMWRLRRECEDPAVGRVQAARNFATWFSSPGVMKNDVPFYAEAEAFAKIYWRNKKEYQKDVDPNAGPNTGPNTAVVSGQAPGAPSVS